jgi:hypothetical protein
LIFTKYTSPSITKTGFANTKTGFDDVIGELKKIDETTRYTDKFEKLNEFPLNVVGK